MDDNGSIVLEMCLITPILVCAVFVVMNMLFIAFNHAAASGRPRAPRSCSARQARPAKASPC